MSRRVMVFWGPFISPCLTTTRAHAGGLHLTILIAIPTHALFCRRGRRTVAGHRKRRRQHWFVFLAMSCRFAGDSRAYACVSKAASLDVCNRPHHVASRLCLPPHSPSHAHSHRIYPRLDLTNCTSARKRRQPAPLRAGLD